ncbi:MAG: hypothetical protein KC484_05445 [Colwelliaceae bacterium]|jgi:hypothetical protein|nr:hypothetical protein [Colwelliaceae bacterium]
MKLIKALVVFCTLSISFHNQASIIFINEIHYDNAGTDRNEFFELIGPAGDSLSGWQVELYNGSDGGTYGSPINLSGIFTNDNNGFGFVAFSVSGIQNGAPDGLALIDNLGSVKQFLSYEGIIKATSGKAKGLTSTDIGLIESASTPVGFSLQLIGSGNSYQDFKWKAAEETQGTVNQQQIIRPITQVPEPKSLGLLITALFLQIFYKKCFKPIRAEYLLYQ